MKLIITLTLILTLTQASSFLGEVAVPDHHNSKAVWFDLYKFPYIENPLEIMMGISCPKLKDCYITGSHPNTLFGIYQTLDINFTSF